MLLLQFYGTFYEFWEGYNPGAGTYGNQKVTFDGVNKLILINDGVLEVSVQTDIYSNWKEWTQVRDNAKFLQALVSIGGDPITDTTSVGITYFLENGWRIKSWAGEHILTINGNIYTREPGEDPYFPIDGNFKVTINTVRSNLVDIVQVQGVDTTKLDELWKLQGLDTDNPLVVSTGNRTSGDIEQTITGTDPVTVTRTA